MLDSIHIAALGMESQQKLVDTISNNIANINTSGYKAAHISFADMVSKPVDQPGANQTLEGTGVQVTGIQRDHTTGELKITNNELDLAISGKGYFELIDDQGNLYYSRGGTFQIDTDGYLSSLNGMPLSKLIQVPSDYVQLSVNQVGEVYAEVQNREDALSLGQLELAYFVNPDALENLGEGVYQATSNSGEAQYFATDDSPSKILQGYQESSNVDMVTELTSLVLAQKAYGMNSRLLQASDEILGLINDLRRG